MERVFPNAPTKPQFEYSPMLLFRLAMVRLAIEKRAEIAFKVAVAKAIDDHTRLGLPVYIWRNNRVVKLSPHRNP
jgi:hypothetical protein